jgi:hypothetical protein
MAGTIMATYKARLLTQLQANSTLSSLQVTYAEPGQSHRREAVFLGDIDNNTHIPESLSSGRRRRIEEFSCEVFVQVSSKPTPQTCEARAVELANAVETVVADDPQLNDLSQLMWTQLRSMSMTTVEADQPVCQIRMLIDARARLQ